MRWRIRKAEESDVGSSPWSFVAMEYYALILNRTYLVSVTDETLVGVVCRGLTSNPGAGLAGLLVTPMVASGDLNDPRSYVNDRRLHASSRANFTIDLKAVTNVRYDKRKKWGMGQYPHDGKVYVETASGEREFIILGAQSGEEIAARLLRHGL
jgi:hypothetical protein